MFFYWVCCSVCLVSSFVLFGVRRFFPSAGGLFSQVSDFDFMF